MVDGKNVIERAHIDNGVSVKTCVAGAVCAAMIHTEGSLGVVEMLDATAYFLNRGFVGVHIRGLILLPRHQTL
jgi:hypothetical protein